MRLNRREFLRATGLASLLTAFGIELPEAQAQEAPHKVWPISEWPMLLIPDDAFPESIDLTGLRDISIELYRPVDWSYSWGSERPLPRYCGPTQWHASAGGSSFDLRDIGLSIEGLKSLIGRERLYRFRASTMGARQYWEGVGELLNFRFLTNPHDHINLFELEIRGSSLIEFVSN